MTSLRVLCLHGYRQNGHMFREKTGSLRKLLKKQVTEFVYIDAPHVIPAHENDHELDATSSSNRSNERGTPGALNIHRQTLFELHSRLVVLYCRSNVRCTRSNLVRSRLRRIHRLRAQLHSRAANTVRRSTRFFARCGLCHVTPGAFGFDHLSISIRSPGR